LGVKPTSESARALVSWDRTRYDWKNNPSSEQLKEVTSPVVKTQTGYGFGKEGQKVPYSFIQPGESRSRAISFFCPGASYLFDKPHLHYPTMLLLNHQTDIVHIQYRYGKENEAFWELSLEERSKWMREDVQAVVSQLLTEHDYEKVIFLGKSIGTMPIVDGLLQSPAYLHAAAILLTPLLTSDMLAANLQKSDHPIFLAIGTEDHFYREDVIEKLRQTKSELHLEIIPNANHALEIGWDVKCSLEALDRVMSSMDSFVKTYLE
jgi:predicted esterase